LGLGLSIAKHLVEAHGGTISAASAGAGKGAEFRVRLPCTPLAGRGSAASATCAERQPLGATSTDATS
jgi:K+-sensing histidine kinase KdpD